MKLMEDVENLKKEKTAAEIEYRNSMPASSYQQQKLRVCEVCSAYLGIHDNDRRLADHFGGKLHLGFITIRERLDELKVCARLFRAIYYSILRACRLSWKRSARKARSTIWKQIDDAIETGTVDAMTATETETVAIVIGETATETEIVVTIATGEIVDAAARGLEIVTESVDMIEGVSDHRSRVATGREAHQTDVSVVETIDVHRATTTTRPSVS